MNESTGTVTVYKKSRASEALQELIDLVNTFPLDFQPPPLYEKAFVAAKASPSKAIQDVWEEVWSEVGALFSPAARSFLGRPVKDMPGFVTRYYLLESARTALRDLAEQQRVTRIGVTLTVDKRGVLEIPRESLLFVLLDVPVVRIKACRICRRIFWAPRINSECCSTKCRKVHNQRQSRENRRQKRRYQAEKRKQAARRILEAALRRTKDVSHGKVSNRG